MQKRQFTKKKRRWRFVITPPGPSRKHEDLIYTFWGNCFTFNFPPFFLFYESKFVFPKQCLFICIILKYLKFRRSPVGGKKWRLVGNWNPKGKKTKKKQKKDKSVSRSKKKRFILSFSTFFPILLSLVIFVLFKHTRAGQRFVFFCYSTGENQLSTRFLQCQSRNTFCFFCDMEVLEDPKKSLFV
jgi:hypothetical protein